MNQRNHRNASALFEESRDFNPDPTRVKLGFVKTEEVICSMYHLGGFKSQNEIPRLAHQHDDHTFKQLPDFKARNRTNDAGKMTSVAKRLTEEDIINISHYISTLDHAWRRQKSDASH